MSKRRKASDQNKHFLPSASGTFVTTSQPFRILTGIAIIAAAVFIAYFPSVSGGFLMDDDLLLTENPHIAASNGLYRFWVTTEVIDYWPMTNTTLWIEWRLWGMHSTGYHISNVLLHIIESLLIWIILRKLSIPGAFLAALIFAVHPVNVESVAWIASRKNLIAMLFFLLSILWCLKYLLSNDETVRSSRHTSCAVPVHEVCGLHSNFWYWLSLTAFVFAMLGKGSVAILPVLLIGIVWWLRKAGADPIIVSTKMGMSSFIRRDLVRTLPFFLVAIALAYVNVWFQTHGTGKVLRHADFIERLLGAGSVVWFYLYKALLPINLTYVYPPWNIETGKLFWWLPLSAAIVVTAVLWRYRKTWSRPYLFAWGFFCVAIVPVMGFTDVGLMEHTLVADRYQHIAIIGVIALSAAGWSIARRKMRGKTRLSINCTAGVFVAVLGYLCWQQNILYANPETLYEETLKKNPNSLLIHNNLGQVLADTGLGNVMRESGRLREAIEHYEKAIRIKPDYVNTYISLGVALVKTGQFQEGIANYKKALSIQPNIIDAYYNLGNVYETIGQYNKAIEHYEKALQINANESKVHSNLSIVLAKVGRLSEAEYECQQAIRLNPYLAEGYCNLASIYAGLGQPSKSIAAAQKALELARSQGQTELAKQIESQLYSNRESHSEVPSAPSFYAPITPLFDGRRK